jgi:hypothetical protein
MMKRRSLVLTSDFARHPFRSSLPPHVFRQIEPDPVRLNRTESWALTRGDVSTFGATYLACFAMVLVFFM